MAISTIRRQHPTPFYGNGPPPPGGRTPVQERRKCIFMITPCSRLPAARPVGTVHRNGEIVVEDIPFWDRLISVWEENDQNAAARAAQVRATPRAELSVEEIHALAERFDPSHMTQEEYDEFIGYLLEKGILQKEETRQIGYHGQYIFRSPTELEHICAAELVHSRFGLSPLHTDGDLLTWVKLCALWENSDSQNPVTSSLSEIRTGAFQTIYQIFSRMQQE